MSTTQPGNHPEPPADGPPPIRFSRRTLLLGAGALGVSATLGYWITVGQPRNAGSSFATPLRIPPLLESELIDGERVFHLTAQAGATELVPGVPFATMGYNGAHLGPTLRATRGDNVRIKVTNELSTPTTTHWHGMVLPARQDGTAHQSILPDSTWTAAWQIDQPAATLWYHPHPHGQTELQVGRGMAGLFLVDDTPEHATPALPSAYGVDDIPLIVQDVALASGGRSPGTPPLAPIGRIGNTVIVNGTYQAHFQASTNLVRFRVLNASAARCYNLELSTKDPFWLVGTDGGLLATPEPLTTLLLSPAERAEILIEVPPDADLVLRSVPHDLGMNHGDNITSGAEDTLELLRITRAGGDAAVSLPLAMSSAALPKREDAVTERHFTLGDTTINGKTMDMSRIDTEIPADSTEVWTVSNTSDRAHNFHIHSTQFAISSVNGAAPEPQNRGRKDTVFIPPGATVELVVPFASFADPTTPYMYHCHLLWHEDQGMMAQYVLVDARAGVEPDVGPGAAPVPTNHHHPGTVAPE